MKKLTVLLLCAALLLSLCACGAPDISGTWQGEIRLTELEHELAHRTVALEDFWEIPAMTGTVRFCFVEGEDANTYKYAVALDGSCRTALLTAAEAAAEAFVADYYEAAAEMLGLDMDGLRRMYNNQRMELDEEMANDKAAQLAELDLGGFLDSYIAGCTGEGTWSIEDKTLLSLDGAAATPFTLNGGELTVSIPQISIWDGELSLGGRQ